MMAAFDYKSVCERVSRYFGYSDPLMTFTVIGSQMEPTVKKYHKVRMVGILFTRPVTNLAQDEIIPNLEYFHARTGENIDFFCAGFCAYVPPASGVECVLDNTGQEVMLKDSNIHWQFDNRGFDRFRRDIEVRTENKWKYSGESDLILINAKYDLQTHTASLDFSSAIVLNLSKAIADKAILSTSELFEDIARFAESHSGDDPTWGYSDHRGKKIGKSVLLDVLMAILPESVRDRFRDSFHFYVRDLSGN